MRARFICLAALTCALALSSAAARPAAADSVDGTRFDLRETSDVVDVAVDRGSATLVVTRVAWNPGPRSDQAVFFLDVPEGAVATRLRTQGKTARGEPIWFEGELMEAESAAHKYQELTGLGGYYPKDPALLSWRSQRLLALQVFPIASRSEKTVEYTLKMPLSYAGGKYKATLPELGTPARHAKVRFAAVHADDRLTVDGIVPSGEVSASRPLEVELAPRTGERIHGDVASIPIGTNRSVVRVALDAAPALSQLPESADVAVVLDASRSMADDFTRATTAARAYLSHFPRANVRVITFDRTVKTPFGPSVSARDAIAKLYGFDPPKKNGSRVDDAIGDADNWLAASSAGAKRILVLTDLRTRDALSPDAVAKRVARSGALVHVATLTGGDANLTRDDDDAWAEVPRKTGGVLYRASVPDRLDDDARRVFLEWARPTRIERMSADGAPENMIAPMELREGERFEHFAIEPKDVAHLEIKGELWSRPVSFRFAPTESQAKLWSALVFGSLVMTELDEAEMMKLATKGGAVSPVTSYLAIEPGVRPSTEGLEPHEGSFGVGMGHGFSVRPGALFGGRAAVLDDPRHELHEAALDALRRCGARATRATFTLETTSTEIVDVGAVTLSPASASTSHCVSEKMWDATLSRAFTFEHESWSVDASVP
jgi:hypothetical protein